MSTPRIFVFCNSCAPQWHSFVAIAEDGTGLAGHICSAHAYADYDMGIAEDGRKRDLYLAHYPDGFEVMRVDFHEAMASIPAFKLAVERNQSAARERGK